MPDDLRNPARRVLLARAASLALGAAATRSPAATGASAIGTTAADETSPGATRERVLRRAVSEPSTLDPLRYGSSSDFAILSDLFTGLTAFGPDGATLPGCAARWRSSGDGLDWRFELRPGLQWSDGTPLTAEDFAWSARRYLDPARAGLLAFRLTALKNAAAISAGRAAPDTLGLRAIDARTVQVELDYPQIDLPAVLAVLLPAPRHRVEALGDDWMRPDNWVSNGAFVLRRRAVGDRIVMARNPRFFDAAAVRLDRVELVVAEAAAAFPRFRAREIDITRVVPEAVAWARRSAPPELRQGAARSTTFVMFNTRRAPFDDARVRRALSLAVDREALARQVRGGDAEPAWTFVAPTTRDYTPTRGPDWRDWPEPRRLAEARRLLAEAGYDAARPLALRLDFIAGTLEKREAVALAAMWRRIGVQATLRSSDPRTLYGNVERGEFEAASTAIAPMLPGPMIWFEVLASEASRRNGGWKHPEFDALVDAARRARSLAERTATLRRAEAIVLAEQPIAPLVFPAWQELVAPRVTAFPDNLTSIRQSRWLAVAD